MVKTVKLHMGIRSHWITIPGLPFISLTSYFADAFIVGRPSTVSRFVAKSRLPGARPTNDISIEFEIRPKFGVL